MPRRNPIQRVRAIGPSRGVAMAPGLVPAANRILTITDNLGDAMATTAGPHGLTGTEDITISGNSVPGYNVAIVVVTTLGPDTFGVGVPFTSIGTGGQWRIT